MNWQVRMKKIDARELKTKHRLEMVMQEFGERFETGGDQWHSKTTPGLIVNIHQQTYEYQQPGMDQEAGDLYDWLKRRFGWTFKMAVTYLQKRVPDPEQEPQSEPMKSDDLPVVSHQANSYSESDYPDEEKEASGLYERGFGSRDGKTYYFYLLKPLDHLQERALEMGGEKMRDYFIYPSWKLWELRELEFHSFAPIQDTWVDDCDLCEEPLKWWWKQKPSFEYQEIFTPGATGATFKKVRIFDEPQVYAFITRYPGDEEDIVICEECKRKSQAFSEALYLLYKSAYKREG
jgi:hypothetical protein